MKACEGVEMKILIDGDACPVVDLTIRIAREYQIEVIVFCDTAHAMTREDVKVVTVSKGNDAVDFKVVNEIKKNDILVTQDYGLAAMALARSSYPIHQNGWVYTNENIDQLLFRRHIGKEIRKRGGKTKGPSKRTREQDETFERNLRALIEKLKDLIR